MIFYHIVQGSALAVANNSSKMFLNIYTNDIKNADYSSKYRL